MADLEFSGCKLAVFIEDKVLTYLRDDKPDIPFPNQWDLPGGGREGRESPEECVLRELFEEFSITLHACDLSEKYSYPSKVSNLNCFFFTTELTLETLTKIKFGDEGQYWTTMPVGEFIEHPDGITELQQAICRSKLAKRLLGT